MCGTRVSTGQTVWFGDRLSDFKTDCLTGKQKVSSWGRLSRSMPSKPVRRLRAICDPLHKQARKSMPCGWTFVKTIYCQIYVWQYNWTYVLFRVLGFRASDVVPRQLYLMQCNHICHIYVLPCCRLYVQYQVAPTWTCRFCQFRMSEVTQAPAWPSQCGCEREHKKTWASMGCWSTKMSCD